MRNIHVVADLCIQRLRDEQTQREAVQKTLDRAFPRPFVPVHLQQLAGEWQFLGFDTNRFSERVAHPNRISRNVARATLERLDFLRQCFLTLGLGAKLDGLVNGLPVEVCFLRFDGGAAGCGGT